MKMAYKWGSGSISRMEGINSQLVECATRALAKSRYDYTIPWRGGLRTDREQHDIFTKGNSKCDGYEKKSYHQSGNALDIIPVEGSIAASYKNYRKLNYMGNLMLCEWQVMLAEGTAKGIMTWGGTFGANSWDRPHFEVKEI